MFSFWHSNTLTLSFQRFQELYNFLFCTTPGRCWDAKLCISIVSTQLCVQQMPLKLAWQSLPVRLKRLKKGTPGGCNLMIILIHRQEGWRLFDTWWIITQCLLHLYCSWTQFFLNLYTQTTDTNWHLLWDHYWTVFMWHYLQWWLNLMLFFLGHEKVYNVIWLCLTKWHSSASMVRVVRICQKSLEEVQEVPSI